MEGHECYIGVLFDIDKTVLATLTDVEKINEAKKRFNELAESEGRPERRVIWTPKDYSDKRKSTDLKRFEFCPMCGQKINWKRLKPVECPGRTYRWLKT